jgi:Zn-dependent protease
MPAAFLACPSCGRLVHADELKRLAASAADAEARGDLAAALAGWRNALDLLPPASVQHQRVAAQLQRLSPAAAGAGAAAVPGPGARGQSRKVIGWLSVLGAAGALLLKFKWVLLFLLGKGKLLLLGLTQAKTVLTMALALGVYTTGYGWKFAAGLIASLYIHEMGHVAWLRRYGIPATAPMFIPGLGAYVRLKQHPATPAEDARVGLAGPIWGACAALGFLVVGLWAGWPSWLATARVGAWINLFNLLPVWQLDGSRAFVALSRRQRGRAAAVLWALVLAAGDGLLIIVAIVATVRALGQGAPAQDDRGVWWTYVALAVGLTAVTKVVPALQP